MAITVVQPFDFNLLELLNATAQKLATAPAHANGRFYYDTVLNQFGVSSNGAWVYLGAQTPFDTEGVQDAVAAMLAGSTGVTITYNDTAGTATLQVAASHITNAMVSGSAAISADKLADGTTNKLLTATERTKLSGIATGATANQTDAYLLARANGTGTQSADTIVAGATNGVLTLTEKTKLSGIAAAATANATDALLRDRSTHTGTQLAATISNLISVIDAQIALTVAAAPSALDTLNELAAALGDDPNFAATISTQMGLKANLSAISAVGLSGQYSALLGKPVYSTTIGDAAATSFVITHNLNTRAVNVDVAYAATPFSSVLPEVQKTSVNTVTILFASAPTLAQFLVTVQA